MSQIFSLPPDVMDVIFCNFLDLRNLCTFDTVVAKSTRLQWLNYLSESKAGRVDTLHLDCFSFRWVIARRINTSHIRLVTCKSKPQIEYHLFDGIRNHSLLRIEIKGLATILDEDLIAISAGCPQLKMIYLGNCVEITNHGVSALALGCANLEDVNFILTSRALGLQAFAGCDQLKVLRLFSYSAITDSCISAVVHGLPKLEMFEFDSNLKITSARAIAPAESPLPNDLNLGRCYVTDAGDVSVEHGNILLTTFCLKGCRTVTDDGIGGLALCRNLQILNITNCIYLTDDAILPLALGCGALEAVTLSGLKLTDVSINAIAKGCPLLKSIDLTNCSEVTHNIIALLAASCPQLHLVDVRGCNTNQLSIPKFPNRHPLLEIKYDDLFGIEDDSDDYNEYDDSFYQSDDSYDSRNNGFGYHCYSDSDYY